MKRREPLRAGRLNRRVQIEKPARVPNGAGGFVKGWEQIGKAWAEMIPLRGDEALEHSVQRATQIWKVTMRWRAGVNEQCRLLFAGKPLNITTCEDPDGKRAELVMTCESGVAT